MYFLHYLQLFIVKVLSIMRRIVNESFIREASYRALKETLNETFFPNDEDYDIYSDQDANIEEKSGKKKSSKAGRKGANKEELSKKRALVISWLKDPAVNCAEIMRKLWHPQKEQEDSMRSFFYKCRDGKKNQSGNPCRFTDSEIVKLFSIHSSSK